MIVMLTQDLSKGFVSWKEMYFENKDALESLGGKLIFAGPHKEDDNKMVVLIDFDSPDSAIGLVYSKNEHETETEWVIMQMLYWESRKIKTVLPKT